MLQHSSTLILCGLLLLAAMPASAHAPAVVLLLLLGVADDLLMGQRLGAGLWNCRLALQPLIACVLITGILWPWFYLVRRVYPEKSNRGG